MEFYCKTIMLKKEKLIEMLQDFCYEWNTSNL